jgi:putative copper export protein
MAQLIIARTVHIASSILLTGIFTFDLVMFGRDRRHGSGDLHEIERRLFRLAVWGLITAFLSALLWFWLEVASMSGLSLTNAFSPTTWRTVLFETQFGRVWQLRLSVIAVVFALVASGLAQDQVRRTAGRYRPMTGTRRCCSFSNTAIASSLMTDEITAAPPRPMTVMTWIIMPTTLPL